MGEKTEIKTIVYATDLGEHTRPVMRFAVAQAKKFGATIVMVHVVEPINYAARAVIEMYMSEEKTRELQKDGMQDVLKVMKKRLKKFCKEELGEKKLNSTMVGEMVVVSGKPSEEILRVAAEHDADLIIMGKSNKQVLGSMVMGSVARRVSRHATIPVVMVPNV